MTKTKPLPPRNLLQELFNYDEKSGILTWKKARTGTIKAGDTAGTVHVANGNKYLVVYLSIDGKSSHYVVHRIAWLYVTGEDPGDFVIDHIDGDSLNNCFSNLRKATHSQNICNSKLRKDNVAGLKGVCFRSQRNNYQASIKKNGKKIYLGTFDTPELAHMAYCKAAAELHGDFARGA